MEASIDVADLVARYRAGLSLPQVAAEFGIPVSTIRYHVMKAGALRGRAEAVRLAARDGRLGSGFRGKRRVFTDEHRRSISRAKQGWAETNAAGISHKASGYVEVTRGEDKGRGLHVTIMEKRLGRRLLPGEHVHHIDGNPSNNDEDNLALVTAAGHARLHRLQEIMSGKIRERDGHGRFR